MVKWENKILTRKVRKTAPQMVLRSTKQQYPQTKPVVPKRKVLVTGGAGFIGSHVAKDCRDLGHEVVVVDDLSGGFMENVPSGVRFRGVTSRTPLSCLSSWKRNGSKSFTIWLPMQPKGCLISFGITTTITIWWPVPT